MKPNKDELSYLISKLSVPTIAKRLCVSSSTVYYWISSYNLTCKPRGYWHQDNCKYNYNYKIFDNEDDVSYYLLGAFLTDGCMKYDRVALSSSDKDWITIIRNLICPNKPLEKENSKCWRLTIHDHRIRKWLLNNGCVPRKSLTLKFPNVPNNYLPDFLRGCLDGDGNISHKKYVRLRNNKPTNYYSTHWDITSASKDFIDQLANVIRANNLSCSIVVRQPNIKPSIINDRIITAKNITYRVTGGHASAYKFLNYLYHPEHRLSMPRKLQLANSIINYYQCKVSGII
jgi:hypothetical protein